VAAQSVLPALWVVVDDGSTDETPAILEEYARRLPYLRVVRRTDRGRRQVGPGVIEAFYAGLEKVRMEDFDYLCKLDMDLDLPVRYFELLMQRSGPPPVSRGLSIHSDGERSTRAAEVLGLVPTARDQQVVLRRIHVEADRCSQ
jgi:glycosyltransferase involved in cell wall biosynthesis